MSSIIKRSAMWLCLSACFATGTSAIADEALLLVDKASRYFLMKADSNGLREIANLGGATLYGESGDVVGLLSGKGTDASVFAAYDKGTLRALGSWSVPGQPASLLSGPSRDVVLNDRFAYFVTIRYTENQPRTGPGLTPFDFHQLSLSDGSLRTIPLPRECANPRLVDLNGVPFLYSWAGTRVWKYEAAEAKFTQVLSNDDLDESETITGSQIPQAGIPAFADYVLLANGGVFRLSSQGTVRQILRSDFSSAGDPKTLSVPSAGRVVRIYGGNPASGPAIGVLQRSEGELHFSLFDADTKKVQWSAKISRSLVGDSIWIARDGSIYYVDANRLSILKTSAGGASTAVVWNLRLAGADVSPHGTRLISLIYPGE